MDWEIIDTGPGTANENMTFDTTLLKEASKYSKPVIHFYDWKYPSATYGYFIKPEQFFDAQKVKDCGLDLAKRPTGGGIIFHTHDFTFSVFIPSSSPHFSLNTLSNYAYINKAVVKAILSINCNIQQPILLHDSSPKNNSPETKFCMAYPTVYDIMIGNKKVGGAAQRRTERGFLHQGSLSLSTPPIDLLKSVLLNPHAIIEMMSQNSYTLIPQDSIANFQSKTKQALKNAIIDILAIK